MADADHSQARPRLYPVTPDGRYFVVRGRLWRCSDPALAPDVRESLMRELMTARRQVGQAKRTDDDDALAQVHAAVDRAKIALGERGPVWWTDGAPDLNRHMARNTPYADWFASLPADEPKSA
jgi:hypothetical protein